MTTWPVSSGPRVARAFHRTLGGIAAIAFTSLAVQLELLFGDEGLAPILSTLALRRERLGETFFDLPSLLHFAHDDGTVTLCAVLGIAIGLVMAAGIRPRRCAFLLWALYLGFVGPGQPFLAFQWDLLLLECLFLAMFLPTDRPARWIHALLLGLCAKLYFESGLAKLLWGGAQWWTGEAMDFYYETAPIPGPLAWWFHALPHGWHVLESRTIVAVELVAPVLLFGPRRIRLAAVGALGAFQLVNVATANYGFFVPLALALHLFALDDGDIERFAARLRRPVPPIVAAAAPRWTRMLAAVVAAHWCLLSWVGARERFGPRTRDRQSSVVRRLEPWHTVSSYHLFGPITTTRDEIEFQIHDGQQWRALTMHAKPGPLDRGGVVVQPHQPRVDFQLWFYGLSYAEGTPAWVQRLLGRLCHSRDLVAPLFREPLPAAPQAVRAVVHRYRFATPAETAKAAGARWTRAPIATLPTMVCRARPGAPKGL